jgi:hypothetical protein
MVYSNHDSKFALIVAGVQFMVQKIQVVAKDVDGRFKSVTVKQGELLPVGAGTVYQILVDGSTKLPTGTKIFRKGVNLRVELAQGEQFEWVRWQCTQGATLVGVESAQLFDDQNKVLPQVTDLTSGALPTSNNATPVCATEAASSAWSFKPIYLAPIGLLALAGAAAGGGGGDAPAAPPADPKASLAKIVAYADDSAAQAPTLAEFTAAGVNVAPANLSAVLSALASAGVAGVQVDTPAKAQAVVDAYNKILLEANGAIPDPASEDPTAQDYAAIGVNVGTAASPLSLLNDVVGAKDVASVDTVAEINALVDAVGHVMNTAKNQGTQLTEADLTALGITGMKPGKLPAVLAAIQATVDDGSQVDTLIELQSLVNVATRSAPTAANTTVKVNGNYLLRLSDFGFADVDGDAISAVRINSGGNLFLNGVALTGGTVVNTAKIVSGQLEWRVPNLNTGVTLEAINFQVVDNFATGTISVAANTLNLSRTVAASSVLDAGGTRFDTVVVAPGLTWQSAYDAAIANGGHLATFESNVGQTTGVASAGLVSPTFYGWLGHEQSSSGAEPGGGWHWITGNTAISWAPGEPSNDGGNGDSGSLNMSLTGTRVNDAGNVILGGYSIEYENQMFVRTGDALEIDLLTGSANADVMAGLGGADVLSGLAGDDRFLVPDTNFSSINGGAGFDVVEYTSTATISGAVLDTKVSDVEGIYLGNGNQALTLAVADVQGMSSTTDTLYIASNAAGDTLDLVEVIGAGANQWHNLGTANGVVTYQYFDANNVGSLTRVLVEQTIAVS